VKLLPEAATAPRVLLVGCGDGGERPFLHERGFETIGFDIHRSPGTDFVADAHRIPLQDSTVDVVISMQVLEHLHSPWIATEEIGRVLRPGGWFIGSVAFLKAFHDSYFHITHKGVQRLLLRAGLEYDYFAGAQSLTYTLYGALVPLGTRPMRRVIFGVFDRMLRGIRTLIWTVTRRANPNAPSDRFHVGIPMSFREFDRLRFAPAVVFRARKPLAAG
jgi:SAM-dependent methyltransferase